MIAEDIFAIRTQRNAYQLYIMIFKAHTSFAPIQKWLSRFTSFYSSLFGKCAILYLINLRLLTNPGVDCGNKPLQLTPLKKELFNAWQTVCGLRISHLRFA